MIIKPAIDTEGHDQANIKTILLVTADTTLQETIACSFGPDNYRVIVAKDNENALFLALQKDIDAFLIDLDIYDSKDLNIALRLREIERYRIVPIVLVTDLDDDLSVEAIIHTKADDYLPKPVNPRLCWVRVQGLLQRMDSLKEVEQVRMNLNRYVSKHTQRVVESYSSTGVIPPPEEQEVCVLFADVRGFTTLSREIDLQTLFFMLSRHLGMQVDCVHRHNGYVDKFGGDGIMAIFDGDECAQQACRCALEIIESSSRGPATTGGGGAPILPVGVGLNLGKVLIGNIGSKEHLDYSVIGETVNLAARLCGQAEQMTIVVSQPVAEAAKVDESLCFVNPRDITVKGIREAIEVYSVERNTGIHGRAVWRGMDKLNYDRRSDGQ